MIVLRPIIYYYVEAPLAAVIYVCLVQYLQVLVFFFYIFSGILSALGNLLSQILEARKNARNGGPVTEIDTAGAARYAIYG
uniref:Uncharacterized protein n=1 Tax=Monopterus albus TaxID=43700 RepID=A0A3Q3KKM4_MONAL